MTDTLKFVKARPVRGTNATSQRRNQLEVTQFFEQLSLHPNRWVQYSIHSSKSASYSRVSELRKGQRHSQYPVEWTSSVNDENQFIVAVRWLSDDTGTALAATPGLMDPHSRAFWAHTKPIDLDMTQIPDGSGALTSKGEIYTLVRGEDPDSGIDTGLWVGVDEANQLSILTHMDMAVEGNGIIYMPIEESE